MVTVRLWKQSDISFVADSASKARWGYTQLDVERCRRYEPNGCFIAQINHKPVGHVFSINYGKMGWIGLLIVKEEHRQKGIGTLLTQKSIDYLRSVGAETIRLEAVDKAVPLYRRLGFKEEFDSLRFNRQLNQSDKFNPDPQTNITPMSQEDLEAVAQFDSKHFGANRLRVLQNLYRDHPKHCFVAKKKNQVIGYIFGRKIPHIYRIGPWVFANGNPQAAKDLLFTCINTLNSKQHEVKIGVPAANKTATKIMNELNFELVSKSIRMVWGEHKHEGDVSGVFAIGGPEKG